MKNLQLAFDVSVDNKPVQVQFTLIELVNEVTRMVCDNDDFGLIRAVDIEKISIELNSDQTAIVYFNPKGFDHTKFSRELAGENWISSNADFDKSGLLRLSLKVNLEILLNEREFVKLFNEYSRSFLEYVLSGD